MRKSSQKLRVRCAAAALAAAMLLTACAGGAASFDKQMELGRKYLSETNYAEAIAAFTEAIRLNPNDIEAYIGRAQAYTALKKYDEATADYTAVIEMTEEQPYQQASAYVGRAGVGEETGRLADAESDYTAALALLGEKNLDAMDDSDAEAARDLKKETLVKHAAVCVTLVLLDKAAEDYGQLEELGQNVAAERSELADLVQDATGVDTDAENNGLTADTMDADAPDTTETPENPDAKDTPDSKETAADSKEEDPTSSKEEAASSKEETAESKQEEQPAQKVTDQVPTGSSRSNASVTYQVGTNTVQTRFWISYDDPEDDWPDGQWVEWDTTYTLSQPVLAVEHPGNDSTLVYVPDGTVITKLEKYREEWWEKTDELEADGTPQYVLTPESSSDNWLIWGAFSSAKEYVKAIGQVWKDETVMGDTSMTVKKGHIYGIAQLGNAKSESAFPAIAFTTD